MDQDQLRRLRDEVAIRNLLSRLAHVVDEGTVEEYVAHFTDDVVWSMTAAPTLGLEAQTSRGRASIAQGFTDRVARGIQGPGSATRHVLTTVAVRLVGPDLAEADAYWQYLTSTTTTPTLAATGAYRYRLARGDDGDWRVSARHIVQG